MKKKKDEIKYFYLLKNAIQLNFDGSKSIQSFPIGDYHISYNGSLLCGKNRINLKKEADTKNCSDTKTRPNGVKVCKGCAEKYKTLSDQPWQKWVVSTNLHGVKNG